MTVKLNNRAFEHAKELIEQGKFVLDEKDKWSEHQPSTHDENEYLKTHGFSEYGKWYLGIDTAEDEETKGRYKFHIQSPCKFPQPLLHLPYNRPFSCVPIVGVVPCADPTRRKPYSSFHF